MNFLEIKNKVDAAFIEHSRITPIKDAQTTDVNDIQVPLKESGTIESHVSNLVSKHFNKALTHARKKINTSVKKKADSMSLSHHKITRVAGKMLRKMAEEIETSTKEETEVTTEIRAAATMHGGELTEYADGVGIIEFRKKAALDHFLIYLDDNDLVDDFEVHAHIHDEDEGSIEEIDLDQIDDDLHVDFIVTFYLFPDIVEFEPSDEYEYDDMEDEFTVEEMVKIKEFYQGSRKALIESVVDSANTALTNKKIRSIAHRDGIVSEFTSSKLNEMKGFSSELQTLIESSELILAAEYIIENYKPSVYAGADRSVDRFSALYEEDETLMEVVRKIKVNARGTRRIKMQCNKGFKWNSTSRSCEKITGAELMTMRKSIRKALITKRSMGSSYKVRVVRKAAKADRYRKSMGLK